MNLEYIGEHIFLQEVESTGQIWVVRGEIGNIYALELDRNGFSLPVWSGRERVDYFLNNARLIGPLYEPHAIPIDVFTARWLSDKMMGINELLINMDGISTRALVLTLDEFRDDFKIAS